MSVAVTEAHFLLHSYHSPKLSKGHFPSAPVITYGHQNESQRLPMAHVGLHVLTLFLVLFRA